MKVLLAIDGSLCSLAAVQRGSHSAVAGGNRCESICSGHNLVSEHA